MISASLALIEASDTNLQVFLRALIKLSDLGVGWQIISMPCSIVIIAYANAMSLFLENGSILLSESLLSSSSVVPTYIQSNLPLKKISMSLAHRK